MKTQCKRLNFGCDWFW